MSESRVSGWIGGAVMLVLSLASSVLIGGIIVPVVKTHCAQQVGAGTMPEIQSSWHLTLAIIPAPDGLQSNDTEFCVRNTPTRELLGAIGVWPLGSPQEQVGAAIQSRITAERTSGR